MLILAAMENSDHMVSLLSEQETDIEAANDHGRTALMQATLWGQVENVRALLEAGANTFL